MSPDPPPVLGDEDIRRILADRIDGDRLSVGAVVGITEFGRRRYIGHGSRDASGAELVDEHTLFEIGSVTKLFTSLLLADMAVRGEVRLDEPIAKLLPAEVRVPQRNGRQITLVDLAGHLSGLPRMPTNLVQTDPTDPYAHYAARDLYEFLSSWRLARTPGDTVEYSNLGFGLLGHALSLRAGGGDYVRLVHERILAPLGMQSTMVTVPEEMLPRMAQGHDAELRPVPDWHMQVLAGAGALRSCACDMLVFLETLVDHGTSPLGSAVALLGASREEGGLGLAQAQPTGGRLIAHGGGTGGFRSHVSCLQPSRRGVVVLSNAAVDVGDLGQHLRDRRWGMLWHRREIAIDPSRLPSLAGRYQLTPWAVIEVTTRDDRLLVQLTGQSAIRVFPTSDRQFFCKSVPAQITFVPADDGRVTHLILHQNGVDRIAERLP